MASSPSTPPVLGAGIGGVRASGSETQHGARPRVVFLTRWGRRETVPHVKDSSAARQSGLERAELESGAEVPTTPVRAAHFQCNVPLHVHGMYPDYLGLAALGSHIWETLN